MLWNRALDRALEIPLRESRAENTPLRAGKQRLQLRHQA
jgi:hypothetical protein